LLNEDYAKRQKSLLKKAPKLRAGMSQPNEGTAMSSDFDWDIDRNERTQELLEQYDVQRAKQFIKENPRPIEQLDLAKYRDFFTDYLEGVKFRDNADWAKVDTAVPIIFGRDEQGRKFPIDGRHRLKKALDDGLPTIPIVSLSKDETQSIRSGVAL
jgi:hypothetical protein